MKPYAEFLTTKRRMPPAWGIDCAPDDVDDRLFDFQRYITAWAVRRGRAAVWADTGLGKTRIQVEWARLILAGRRGLILAPLAVAAQTVREAARIGVEIAYVRDQAEADAAQTAVCITNYERLHLFTPDAFTAVVLDESSVIKDVTTKTRDAVIAAFQATTYRLACTATPAPNDVAELANHAEFLGVATRSQMLSMYFTHDDDGWRLKGHASDAFWAWVATWAVALRKPSDLGFDDAGYNLPALTITPHLLDVDATPHDQLFATDLGGVGGRAKVRRATLSDRCTKAAELVEAEPAEPWLLWVGMNDEAHELAELIPKAVNVHGSMAPEEKAELLLAFTNGQIQHLITKPSIAGFGMNWQHCARMAFVGLGDSYEQYYQSIRRCYRFGQDRPVDVHIVLSELEGQIAGNVARKERQALRAHDRLIAHMRRAHSMEEAS